jgi:hypothetical protein
VCHREHGYVLAVPNSSPLVAKLFEGTDWAGTPGSGGPWKDALRQAPPEIVVHDKTSTASASPACMSGAA